MQPPISSYFYKIDFYSIKKNKVSNSQLKIFEFSLKELPALTKILTLASLQGIADILSGEGVGFDELEQIEKDIAEAYREQSGVDLSLTTENSTIQNQKLEDKFAVESAFYSSLDYKLLPKLQLNFGLRLSNFLRLGQKINTYENDKPLLFIDSVQIYEEATPLGFIEYSKSEVIKQFTNLEPRFSLAYKIANDKSFEEHCLQVILL